jgi:predicted nuclease with TOPRIM domain
MTRILTAEEVLWDAPPVPCEHSDIKDRLETLKTQRAEAEQQIARIDHEAENLPARLAELAMGTNGVDAESLGRASPQARPREVLSVTARERVP